MGNWHRFDAEEHKDLVECWEVGDEVGENGWNARNKLRVNESNATNANDSKVWAEAQEPVD